MRFKKTKEKDGKTYWCAVKVNRGQTMSDVFWLIYSHGAGFNLFRKVGFGRSAEKICHVKKLKSAKQIANLMQNG
jgi:hypothetical protein